MTVYYGLKILEHLTIQPFWLDSSSKKVSVRFTGKAKTVEKIYLWIGPIKGTPPTYRIGLQQDLNGEPSGSWLGSNTFTPTDDYSYAIVTLDSPVELTEANIYHIVVQYESGTIDENNCFRPLTDYAGSLIPIYKSSADATIDGNYACLTTTDGVNWTEHKDWIAGCFLYFSDGEKYLFGSTTLTSRNIYADAQEAELITVYGIKIISGVVIELKKTGTPDSLTVTMYNITDDAEEGSITISPEEVQTTWSFITKNFANNIKLETDKQYRLILKSPSSDINNYYSVSILSSYPYTDISWMGDKCYRQNSSDGGTSWVNWKIHDLVLNLIVEFNPAIKTAVNGGL